MRTKDSGLSDWYVGDTSLIPCGRRRRVAALILNMLHFGSMGEVKNSGRFYGVKVSQNSLQSGQKLFYHLRCSFQLVVMQVVPCAIYVYQFTFWHDRGHLFVGFAYVR
jgi:hypothetical protein